MGGWWLLEDSADLGLYLEFSFPLFKIYFMYKKKIIFWLCWVFVAVHRLSLVVASRAYSVVAVHKLLIVVASHVVAPWALGAQA